MLVVLVVLVVVVVPLKGKQVLVVWVSEWDNKYGVTDLSSIDAR